MFESRPSVSSASRRGGVFERLRALVSRRRRSRGATTVEHALIMSLALGGAVGFKELGTKLQSQLEREGQHIEGKGMPKNGGLASLAASFETPSAELGCPGAGCGLPALSMAPGGEGLPNASVPSDPGNPVSELPASGAPVSGPRPFTLAQRERKQTCEERLAASPQEYFDLKNTSRKKRDRPKQRAGAIARLCTEMVCECPPHKTEDQCLKQWLCIYGYVAQHPTSQYFDNASATGDDECPDTAAKNGHNQSIQNQCLDKQLTQWACKQTPVVGPVGDGMPVVTTTSIPPSGISTTPTNRNNDVSQAAGEDAARIFRDKNFKDYECFEQGGPNEFDMVCVQGDRVVIVEAKGGGSGLGKRLGPNQEYVQQGTLDYARAEADVMSRLTLEDGSSVPDKVREAIEKGTIRYFEVRQPFDPRTGRAITPEITEFDLYNPNSACQDCNCTGP
jgi:hypothetical protein